MSLPTSVLGMQAEIAHRAAAAGIAAAEIARPILRRRDVSLHLKLRAVSAMVDTRLM